MALVSKAVRAFTKAAEESAETAMRTQFPGLSTTASTVSKLIQEANDRKARELSQISDEYHKATVDENEFYFYLNRVKKLWSWSPWQILLKVVRWMSPGFSNLDTHINALRQLDKLAREKKANYYAFEASNFLVDKIDSMISRSGFISRLFFSPDDLKGDAKLEAYINSAELWMKVMDNKDKNDKFNLQDIRSKISNYPDFIKDRFNKILESKLKAFDK